MTTKALSLYFIAMLGFSTIQAFAATPALPTDPNRIHTPSTLLKLPIRGPVRPGIRWAQAQTAAYSIVDVGAPPQSVFAASLPRQFNATGQIVGTGVVQLGGEGGFPLECALWTGTIFLNLSSTLDVRDCTPAAISNMNSKSKQYTFAGTAGTITSSSEMAFSGVGTAISATSRLFLRNNPSSLTMISANGQVAGSFWYRPFGTGTPFAWLNYLVPATLKDGELVPIQEQCEYQGSLCLSSVVAINDSGTLVGYDLTNSRFMAYTLGKITSGVDLAQIPTHGSAGFFLNDSGQIAYGYTTASTATVNVTAIGSSKTTSIGIIPGNSCTQYVATGQNNAGSIFGYTANCLNPDDVLSWIWDVTNHLRTVTIPANALYSSVEPVGPINDNGQILAELFSTTGGAHWGYLQPNQTTKVPARVGRPRP